MAAMIPFSLVALALLPESTALIRAERFSSHSLQHLRDKRQAYPYTYGYVAQGQGYAYPQYSASYPSYSSFGNYYNSQSPYGGMYQPQYGQYQQYPSYNYYNTYYRGYGTGSYYQQPPGGGLQRDRWGNSYMMLGNFKLNVACKSRGCPGK